MNELIPKGKVAQMGGDESAALDPALAELDRLRGRSRGRLEDLERPLERQIHGGALTPAQTVTVLFFLWQTNFFLFLCALRCCFGATKCAPATGR
jgi:hypothetical protein